MKDTSHWQQRLAHNLRRERSLVELTPRQFFEVELGLFLVTSLLPDAPLTVLPALLNGYELPFTERHNWTDTQLGYIRRARFVINAFKHVSIWRDLLTKYIAEPDNLRGFTVNLELTGAVRQAVSICADRFEAFEMVLNTPLPTRSTNVQWAVPGREYTAESGGVHLHFKLPDDLTFRLPNAHQVQARQSRTPMCISREEVIEMARWTQNEERKRGLRSRRWVEWATNLRLETYHTTLQEFRQSDHLTVDGTTNVVGMLSAGKSTLMDILAIWAARTGRRIILIVGDVGDVLNRCDYFQRLGLRAVPLLGRSNRAVHLGRLHNAAVNDNNQTTIHHGYRWLSTACSLPAMATEPVSFPVGRHPCLNLHLAADETSYACPLYADCAYHNAQKELVDAPIWVGTPASLLYTRADQQLTDTTTQLAELVYKTSDIVIVDEADRVQVQLDMAFSPGQTLANNYCQGWLDQLVRHIRDVQTRQGRQVRTDSLISTYLRMAEAASTACEGLYTLLIQEPGIRKWLHGQQYFSAWLLFDHLAHELIEELPEASNNDRQPLPEVFETFLTQRDPLGEEQESELCAFARKIITQTLNRPRLWQELIEWIENQPVFNAALTDQGKSKIALKLEFTLLVSVLENRLNHLIKNWNQVEGTLNLSEWGSNIFNDPPKEFLSLVPVSAAGNVLAFRYEGSDENPAGQLTFFKNMGAGRHLLLNLHRLYEVDDAQGPNVLLLSGTSWAGTSPSYHLQLPVAALLRTPEKEMAGIGKSQFYFRPFRDQKDNPISVSGKRDLNARQRSLEGLVREIVKVDRVSKLSLVENHWNSIPTTRRRALFIVGSYREARAVKDYIIHYRPDWTENVVALVPDSTQVQNDLNDQQQTVLRSKVQGFALGKGRILIAPLLAIERGHNILNEVGEAGLGVAYFLVRPHPHPDDLSLVVKSLNRWALDTHNNRGWFERQANGELLDAERIANLFKREAVKRWNKLMRMPIRFATMPSAELDAFYWDQLVSIWQVIGRLIRGGVPAQIYFCDAAFAPNTVNGSDDTPRSSLLVGLLALLKPYFDEMSDISPEERAIVQALYRPFFQALSSIKGLQHDIRVDSSAGIPSGVA